MDLRMKRIYRYDFKSFCNEEQVAKVDEILAKVEELKEKIISGEIVVSNYEGYGPDAE